MIHLSKSLGKETCRGKASKSPQGKNKFDIFEEQPGTPWGLKRAGHDWACTHTLKCLRRMGMGWGSGVGWDERGRQGPHPVHLPLTVSIPSFCCSLQAAGVLKITSPRSFRTRTEQESRSSGAWLTNMYLSSLTEVGKWMIRCEWYLAAPTWMGSEAYISVECAVLQGKQGRPRGQIWLAACFYKVHELKQFLHIYIFEKISKEEEYFET